MARGKVKEPTITVEPMDFTDCKVTTPEPDADWERAIAKGGPGVGLSPEMPGFEDSLTPEQISGFVAHMRGFCKESGWPSGNNNFPRPIMTEKAFPENEFLLLPAVSHETEPGQRRPPTSASSRSTNAGSAGGPCTKSASRSTTGISRSERDSEIGDVAVAIKYAAYASATTPRIVSFGLETTLPTGQEYKGFGKGTVVFEPFVAAGTMLGNWYVQASGKVELPVDTPGRSRVSLQSVCRARYQRRAEHLDPRRGAERGEPRTVDYSAGSQGPHRHGRAGRIARRLDSGQVPRREGCVMGRLLALGILGTVPRRR